MRWLEIIKLRSSRNNTGAFKEILASVDELSQSGLTEIRVYRHAVLESDLSLHLYWETKGPERDGSGLGLHLAQTLKDFGLLDHTIWIRAQRTIKKNNG